MHESRPQEMLCQDYLENQLDVWLEEIIYDGKDTVDLSAMNFGFYHNNTDLLIENLNGNDISEIIYDKMMQICQEQRRQFDKSYGYFMQQWGEFSNMRGESSEWEKSLSRHGARPPRGEEAAKGIVAEMMLLYHQYMMQASLQVEQLWKLLSQTIGNCIHVSHFANSLHDFIIKELFRPSKIFNPKDVLPLLPVYHKITFLDIKKKSQHREDLVKYTPEEFQAAKIEHYEPQRLKISSLSRRKKMQADHVAMKDTIWMALYEQLHHNSELILDQSKGYYDRNSILNKTKKIPHCSETKDIYQPLQDSPYFQFHEDCRLRQGELLENKLSRRSLDLLTSIHEQSGLKRMMNPLDLRRDTSYLNFKDDLDDLEDMQAPPQISKKKSRRKRKRKTEQIAESGKLAAEQISTQEKELLSYLEALQIKDSERMDCNIDDTYRQRWKQKITQSAGRVEIKSNGAQDKEKGQKEEKGEKEKQKQKNAPFEPVLIPKGKRSKKK